MGARPGKMQNSFNSGELSPLMVERHELKYHNSGLRYASNIRMTPQGGFSVRDGSRHVAALEAGAQRLFDFTASDGSVFELVLSTGKVHIVDEAGAQTEVVLPYGAADLSGLSVVQQLDTAVFLHQDHAPRRLIYDGSGWQTDLLPLSNIPLHDYGATYTNGTAAVWELEFIGFGKNTTPGITDTAFVLTVSNQDTISLTPAGSSAGTNIDEASLASAIEAAILALPGVKPGISVAAAGDNLVRITFSGAGNLGDGWAVSGRVINDADTAITARKVTVGVEPGEEIISEARGWPSCGAFYLQRLLLGGLKGLPNNILVSTIGDYFNFDTRLDQADGAFVLPMNSAGGEAIKAIVPARNLLIFTNRAEYWLADRELSKTKPPELAEGARNGVKGGVPVVESEGAAVFANASGGVISEFRGSEIEGNFITQPLSLLASHLVSDVRDIAVRKALRSEDGNVMAVVLGDGNLRLCTLVRDQEVTGFARMASDGLFKAALGTSRNDMSLIVERGGARRLERLEEGLLLDAARDVTPAPDGMSLSGLNDLEGKSVWAIADMEVLGPFVVSGGAITLPFPVLGVATVGLWQPPIVDTLPLSRMVGPELWLQRPARIHTVHLYLKDTTSLSVGVNGLAPRAVNLKRYGDQADVPELAAGFTDVLTLRGLKGYHMDPFVRLTQERPGRLTVTAMVIEAKL